MSMIREPQDTSSVEATIRKRKTTTLPSDTVKAVDKLIERDTGQKRLEV